jgi:GTP-sensing pleiotropic transcriptional regulator CodY
MLAQFCDTYQLSPEIYAALNTLKISSPHTLKWITDNLLKGEGRLVPSEIADVQDAEEEWKNGS